MICTTCTLSFPTSVQIYLGASSLQRLRCGISFLAFGQGSRRKAF